MFGAAPYLEMEFGLEPREAEDALVKWMKSFEKEPETEPVEDVDTGEPEAEETAEEFLESVDRGEEGTRTRFESCPEFSPAEYVTYAYHEKDAKYYRVDRFTDKRAYFSKDSNKKFAPKTSIGHYNVIGIKSE
ncbi:hypothetical protein AKJ59_00180 [candidate division MSBL1 archaeon SCGC-AAA385M02]|uniref:Uncharacterized protein n=1 Tax=candidate division MSBL1 archaeon SCGC-AAA385M02 TaxID=1698287 RepID=A0A133VR35_9EURY|nr:hypothetical protein AKJ59_00180 [candidate division MSBL1 archaeon SCGC-AAA385M02]